MEEALAVKIKEEPLDFDYERAEVESAITAAQEQEATELDIAAHLKIEFDEPQITEQAQVTSLPTDSFKIVAEQKDLITVNAADYKSEDERVFIAGLRLKKFSTAPVIRKRLPMPSIACKQCPVVRFATLEQLELHQMLHHRSIKCLICSYACETVVELSEHMKTHENILDTKFTSPSENKKSATLKRKRLSAESEEAKITTKRNAVSERLRQIEDNLISNSIKSPPPRNDIEIKQEIPEVSPELDAERILPETNPPKTNPSAIKSIVPQIDIKKELDDAEYCEIKIKTEPIWETDEIDELPKQYTSSASSASSTVSTYSSSSTASASSFSPSSTISSSTTNNSYLESLRHMRLRPQNLNTDTSNTATKDTPQPVYKNIQLLNKLGHPSLKGLKIIKLAPNTKIVRLAPTATKASHPITMPPLTGLSGKPFIGLNNVKTVVLKTKISTNTSPPQALSYTGSKSSINSLIFSDSQSSLSTLSTKSTLSPLTAPRLKACDTPAVATNVNEETKKLLNNRGIIVTKIPVVKPAPLAVPQPGPPLVTLSLSSLRSDTTIDAQDLQKLLTQVRHKAVQNEQKILTIPNDVLHAIERMPEKRELIDDMRQKIRAIQQSGESVLHGWKSDQMKFETAVKTDDKSSGVNDNSGSESAHSSSSPNSKPAAISNNTPSTLYLRVTSKIDAELIKARHLNPDYFFIWMCPRCPCQYRQKFSFQNHLVSAHGLSDEELKKLYAEVRAFKQVLSSESVAAKTTATEQASNKIKIEKKPCDVYVDKDASASSADSSTAATDIAPIKMSALKSSNGAAKKPKNKFTCTKCGRTCSSKMMLNDHVRANCSREPLYPCPKCSKRFYSTSTLTCHMTIHTGVLPHGCTFCDKRFRTRGQVTVHHRTHTGERPFTCQVCSQSFTHRETLISHLSRHIGMKRYKCYACQKHFSCISGLKTHRDLRPDTCAKVKLSTRAIGPRVRVVRGQVIFEQQPAVNPYLRTEDPQEVLADIQNQLST